MARLIIPIVAVLPITIFLAVVIALFMALAITWHIDIVVPIVANKIDRLTAGMIFGTMFLPVLAMTGRYAQVHRCHRNTDRHRLYHHRP